MIRNLNKTNMAAEDVESIGTGFAKKYYDALVGEPNASALRHFYNAQSKYVHVQTGRPDCEMDGLYLIGRFLRQMEYGKCTIAIRSVATARREDQAEFVVTSVCEISRPETVVARTFTQTSAIKRVAWTTSDFQIVRTELKYNDDIVDFSVPIAVGDKPKVSSAISTDISGKCVKPTVDSDKKSTRKIKVVRAPADRCGKVNGLGKKPMTTPLTAVAVVPHGNVHGQSRPLRTENKGTHGTAMVLGKKDTGKPTVTMPRPVAKNAVKDESGKPKEPATVNKTVGDFGRKDSNNVQRTTSIRPAPGGQISFVSTNRYGYLAEMDPDCPSDVRVDNLHLLASGGKPREAAFNYDRTKKFQCAKSTTATQNNEFGNADKSHRKGSMEENKRKQRKIGVDTETVQRSLRDERSEVVHQVHTPKRNINEKKRPDRKIELVMPTASEKDDKNKTEGRSKKNRRNRKKRGCKGNNGSVVTPKGSSEVEVAEPRNFYIRQLGQGLALVKEFVRPMFFNLTFNPLK